MLTPEQLELAVEEDCDTRSVFTHPIVQRILAQAISHGDLCPRRASIHPFEYQRLQWHITARDELLRTPTSKRALEEFYGTRVLQLYNGSVVINLFPSEEVPYGAIRWEPSDY